MLATARPSCLSSAAASWSKKSAWELNAAGLPGLTDHVSHVALSQHLLSMQHTSSFGAAPHRAALHSNASGVNVTSSSKFIALAMLYLKILGF